VKSNKHNWIPFLSLLLVFLQSLPTLGHAPTVSSEILNPQEELAFFKTKSAKALVFHEISVTSVELIVSGGSATKGFLFEPFHWQTYELSKKESKYLIDFRSALTTQIFPFHFFL